MLSTGDIWHYSFRLFSPNVPVLAFGLATYWSKNDIDLEFRILFLTFISSFENPAVLTDESISSLAFVKTVDFFRMPLLGALIVFLFKSGLEPLILAACFKSLELFIELLVKLVVVHVVGLELKPWLD